MPIRFACSYESTILRDDRLSLGFRDADQNRLRTRLSDVTLPGTARGAKTTCDQHRDDVAHPADAWQTRCQGAALSYSSRMRLDRLHLWLERHCRCCSQSTAAFTCGRP